MDETWQILRDGGLPLAEPGTGQRRSSRELAHAITVAVASDPTGREADALAAYILAWRHHWPTSFCAELGAQAERSVTWAEHHVTDPDRYLKLRRIALENLAAVL